MAEAQKLALMVAVAGVVVRRGRAEPVGTVRQAPPLTVARAAVGLEADREVLVQVRILKMEAQGVMVRVGWAARLAARVEMEAHPVK